MKTLTLHSLKKTNHKGVSYGQGNDLHEFLLLLYINMMMWKMLHASVL